MNKFNQIVNMFLLIFFCNCYAQKLNDEPLLVEKQKFFSVCERCKPDISFLAMDIKYNPDKEGEEVKILEFGEGVFAGLRGHDNLVDFNIDIGNNTFIWASFWNYLKKFNIPAYLVTYWMKPSLSFASQLDHAKKISYPAFAKMGGSMFHSIKELRDNKDFRALKENVSRNNYSLISDYKALAIINHHKYSNLNHNVYSCKKCSEIRSFKKNNPQILTLCDASRFYVNNKNITHELFNDDHRLSLYRPQCKIYKKDYWKTMVSRVQQDFNTKTIVIKPINSYGGNGIIFVQPDNLEEVFKKIFGEAKRRKKVIKNKNKRDPYNYWEFDNNDYFIVESFEESKHVECGGKIYDPTMRVVVSLFHEKGLITTNFYSCYWKIPLKSLDQKGSFRELHISHSPVTQMQDNYSFQVSKNDRIGVVEILSNILPELYVKMLRARENNVFDW